MKPEYKGLSKRNWHRSVPSNVPVTYNFGGKFQWSAHDVFVVCLTHIIRLWPDCCYQTHDNNWEACEINSSMVKITDPKNLQKKISKYCLKCNYNWDWVIEHSKSLAVQSELRFSLVYAASFSVRFCCTLSFSSPIRSPPKLFSAVKKRKCGETNGNACNSV